MFLKLNTILSDRYLRKLSGRHLVCCNLRAVYIFDFIMHSTESLRLVSEYYASFSDHRAVVLQPESESDQSIV